MSVAWLPVGKTAAVVLSVDDVHPADVAIEALDHLRELQRRHPALRPTLFVTSDWRTKEPYPSSRGIHRVPFIGDLMFQVPVYAKGTFRLDRHESFCRYLRSWTGIELGIHGLHHVRRGPQPIHEFAGRSVDACVAILQRALAIFERAGLEVIRGASPPGWNAPPAMMAAMEQLHFQFVASARDLDTPPAAGALAAGSGLQGVPLMEPQRVGSLVHLPTNFQATSAIERGVAILQLGGLLSIKAHLLARSGTYRALDGLTADYGSHLDRMLTTIEQQFGDSIWWTSMGEIAKRLV
jgi:hypothetical protein